tara:strand:+ start:4865 stop:5302 length:438 start_codon:yes stop_codon:yes gene_type:complete
MFNFFKKKSLKEDINNSNNKNELFIGTAALLIHAAKIDENYTNNEKNLIKKTLLELGLEDTKIDETILNAENLEKNSNQLIDFTKIIKNSDNSFKIKIIEILWNIIYSDNKADMFESNLMRRISGLLYIDDKLVGEIKEKVKKKF